MSRTKIKYTALDVAGSVTASDIAAGSKTGTGNIVFSTSPTLVTPDLGTPSAVTLTNATGLPVSTGISGLASGVATFLATPSSANLISAITDETGTGSLVFATSPTLVTPNLGTPSAVTLTNATGLPVSTGISGLGTGVATFLATPSSANLISAITDETGTGSLVFATSPTLVTPTLGAATATSVNGLTITSSTGTLTVANGSTLATSGANSITLTSTGATNVTLPTSGTLATTTYVDGVAQGLDVKASVRAATTANLAATRTSNVLTADANGAISVDSVSLALNDRVLVKNQTTTADNGIYYVSVVGDGSNPFELTRATDADSSAEVTAGMFTFVAEGTTNADSGWVLTTNDPITLNTTGLSFSQFSGAGSIEAGDGLTKSGNTLNVVTADSNNIVVNADSIDLGEALTTTTMAAATSVTSPLFTNAGAMTVSTTASNGNISLSPNGTGTIQVGGTNPTIAASTSDSRLFLQPNGGATVYNSAVIALPSANSTLLNVLGAKENTGATTETRLNIYKTGAAPENAAVGLKTVKSSGVYQHGVEFAAGEAFSIIDDATATFMNVDTSKKLSLSSQGTNQDLAISPSGTGKVAIGGSAPTITSSDSDGLKLEATAGELIFTDTRLSSIEFSDATYTTLPVGATSVVGGIALASIEPTAMLEVKAGQSLSAGTALDVVSPSGTIFTSITNSLAATTPAFDNSKVSTVVEYLKRAEVYVNGQLMTHETAFTSTGTGLTYDYARGDNSVGFEDNKIFFSFGLVAGDVVVIKAKNV